MPRIAGLLKAPFPYFGGKRRVAPIVWQAFGDIPNYVEPFAGSLAVPLCRPHEARIETVNDIDADIANFWRAVTAEPAEVARWCDWPVNEADLTARRRSLIEQSPAHRERMFRDAAYYDVKRAGWWVWGLSQWIGTGFCEGPERKPYMRNDGAGVHQRMPSVGHSGRGVHAPERAALTEWFAALQARLRRVRVLCGDWARVVTPSVTGDSNSAGNMGMRPCGVFLDPPYEGKGDVYANNGAGVSAAVREWAIANGDKPSLRIALCGYAGEHAMPGNWTEHAWKAWGGYGNRNGAKANVNATRERIWFSQHCLPLDEQRAPQSPLFNA